eukprot:12172883-Alexandrium_andersonii.AAC.1
MPSAEVALLSVAGSAPSRALLKFSPLKGDKSCALKVWTRANFPHCVPGTRAMHLSEVAMCGMWPL